MNLIYVALELNPLEIPSLRKIVIKYNLEEYFGIDV
jgi:hypothetical protein